MNVAWRRANATPLDPTQPQRPKPKKVALRPPQATAFITSPCLSLTFGGLPRPRDGSCYVASSPQSRDFSCLGLIRCLRLEAI
jgi:hypothetical protein